MKKDNKRFWDQDNNEQGFVLDIFMSRALK